MSRESIVELSAGVMKHSRLNCINNRKSITFQGTVWHGTEPYAGDRVVSISYVPRDWEKIGADNSKVLRSIGFRVSQIAQPSAVHRSKVQEETGLTHSCFGGKLHHLRRRYPRIDKWLASDPKPFIH